MAPFGERPGLHYRGEKNSSTPKDEDEATLPTYTWEELSKHTTEESCWIGIHGKVYDVTSWISTHPGGVETLLLASGRDSTAAYESYHPFTDKPDQILSKYEIGVLGSHEYPPYAPDTGFYKEVCSRVGRYFEKNKINPKDPIPALWRMTLVFLCAFATFYYGFSRVLDSMIIRCLFCMLFGVFQALPLLHIMHDSSHMAFGPSEKWWQIGGRFAMDFFAGAQMTSWHNQHTIGHHIYTNVILADPDLPSDLGRDPRHLVERQKFMSFHKYQHIYLPPLYGILSIKFRFQDFLETFGGGHNGPIRVNPISTFMWGELIVSKLVWVGWRFLLPFYLFDYSIDSTSDWMEIVALNTLAEFITGYYLAFNFQVSHVSTTCDYPLGSDDSSEISDEWAISQVRTSVDYSHGNYLTTFLAGALNYQATHHLFPCVSQYHYPAIAPIVMEVCKEYEVNYKVLPSFAEAFACHILYLKEMGEKGQSVPFEMG